MYTLGSLFDGSGGFPLAGSLCGITPVWASEVEPYPIAVTRSRFPDMIHLGDISKINGAEIPPVDIITFGSPCQDLSIAGKRAGLKHEDNGDEETTRSGLFMEAVRIIKEMRKATNGKYPTFALWENVPGAFSSNRGEDFRVVCEELIKIVEPTAVMPPVPSKGWAYADSYIGNGWSLAYRVFDAQYWGVPQRRRRIHLILDLGGQRARKVLFERQGLRGYFEESGTPWESPAEDAERGIGADDRERAVPYTLKMRSGCEGGGKGALWQEDMSATLATNNDQYLFQPVAIVDSIGGQAERGWIGSVAPTLKASHCKAPPTIAYPAAGFCTEHSAQARGIGYQDEVSPTLRAGVTPACVYSIENHPADSRVDIDESGKVQTLTSRMGTGGGNVPMVMEGIPIQDQATRYSGKRGDKSDGKGNGLGVGEGDEPMYTLTGGDRHAVCYGEAVSLLGDTVAGTLMARDYKGIGRHDTLGSAVCIPTETRYIVRRLTPTECARLQGFADRWGDIDPKDDFTDDEFAFWFDVRNTHAEINGKSVNGYTKAQMLTWYNKLGTDSAEYKMWGNGIALPPALYCLQGMSDVLCGLS